MQTAQRTNTKTLGTRRITMECPYCNGSGHHNYNDCIKCSGTGEYEQSTIEHSNSGKSSSFRIVLIWGGFFVLIPLLVYVVIFFQRLGIATEMTLFALSAASWIIIYQAISKLVN
jgi:hypothetical protein